MEKVQEGDMTRGTGAIPDALDNRDYQYAKVATAFPPFDWTLGYDIETKIGKKLKVKDQDGSGSCGGQAFSYYGMAIDPDNEEKSAKFIYSQVFIPPAGSSGRDLATLVCNKGWADESLCVSYDGGFPPSEAFMERVSDITPQAISDALIDTALSYANVQINIDDLAQAIRNNGGLVIGIAGKNNGTWTTTFPLPPASVDNTCWNHWVYCGKAKMINGKKYIGFLNSWGESVGEKGWQWLTEDYLQQPFVWSAWTLVYNFPKPEKYIFKTLMKQGSVGGEVKELQKRVNAVPVDGIFGPNTKAKVKLWQSSHGLTADGIVGPKTLAALNGTSNPLQVIKDIITKSCLANGVEPLLGISVATAESGLNPNATLFNTASNSVDRGLFQWNSKYHPEVTDALAFDPMQATRLFCDAVKQGHLVDYWSASEVNWAKMLTPEIKTKYNILL